MADAYINVNDGAAKKMQTYRNTVGADSVDAEAVALVDSSGNPLTVFPVNDNGGSLTVDGSVSVSNLPATQATKETRSATAATSQVADTATSTQLLASNANRLGATILNDSSARLYIKLGATASVTDYTVSLAQNDYYEVPFNYTGNIDGIWASDPNNGAARITELT